MSRKYRNPPLVEALCEFQFVPSQPWDMTIPGLLYEKVRSDFPEKQQQRITVASAFQSGQGGVAQRVESDQRMQFIRSDKSALLQVAPDLFTINHLTPYPTWEIFKPLILNNLEKCQDIAKPKGFRRIGLRYINKIGFNERPIELADYFNYYPFIPTELPQTHGTFQIGVEFPYEGGLDLLRLTFKSVIPEKSEVLALLLDIDYSVSMPESISLHQASDWLEKAHTNIEKAFELCMTDKCRTLFGEER